MVESAALVVVGVSVVALSALGMVAYSTGLAKSTAKHESPCHHGPRKWSARASSHII